MKTQPGVLADGILYWLDATKQEHHVLVNIATMGDVCELALGAKLHSVWVLPGSQLSQQVKDTPLFVSNDYDAFFRYRDKTTVPVACAIQRRSGTYEQTRRVFVFFPEHDPKWLTDDDTWALADIENAHDLLQVIASVEHELTPRKLVRGCMEEGKFKLLYSPGYCGMSLMRSYIELYAHNGWTRPADLSQLPDVAEPGGYHWLRELTSDEQACLYIHFFDRNAQFPAACTGAELGEGTPTHTTEYNEKLPGVWSVTILEEPEQDNHLLPPVASVGTTIWCYTSTVQALQARGYVFAVHSGYVWPIHHRTLQDWAKGMWEARKRLREKYGKNSPQEHMAKMITNRGMGWLDLVTVKQRGREKEKDIDNRPDWYNTIRALARYRLTLKMLEIAKLGMFPVMIVADNIAYVSNNRIPELAVPNIMQRSTELGGFKHDGTYLLRDVLPLMKQYGPNDIRRHVKKLEKVQVQ